MTDQQIAVARVAEFLSMNYPCRCTDPECPGYEDEAFLLVDIVVETLLPDAHAYIRSLKRQLADALGL
ncbi:hypothetical protein [Agromyces binzhouensis]|uniref:hypothetical protein n=1 Tax=Agromyces binzhouensis TaxID=1817495 RepID=UPI003629C98F